MFKPFQSVHLIHIFRLKRIRYGLCHSQIIEFPGYEKGLLPPSHLSSTLDRIFVIGNYLPKQCILNIAIDDNNRYGKLTGYIEKMLLWHINDKQRIQRPF
ncbi:hypothetical protein D3C77_452350 [compost metagenome]